tara:strand:- start:387 stop:524 length:138 start_codon:yes stop_codon:yes gene_type:complete
MDTYVVTCKTANCINKDVAIEVVKPADGDVVCGPCKQAITDVVKK